jgi:GGDEF domain-containing protein
VGISIGVASCPEFDAVEDALLAADARLYADKTYRKTRATQRRAPLWPVQNSASA